MLVWFAWARQRYAAAIQRMRPSARDQLDANDYSKTRREVRELTCAWSRRASGVVFATDYSAQRGRARQRPRGLGSGAASLPLFEARQCWSQQNRTPHTLQQYPTHRLMFRSALKISLPSIRSSRAETQSNPHKQQIHENLP